MYRQSLFDRLCRFAHGSLYRICYTVSMLTYVQAITIGLLQGITELFPISSLGHSVILPKLLGWDLQQSNPFFLTFLVATHLATAIVLFIFFWNDWKRIITHMLRSIRMRRIAPDDYSAKLGWLLVVGTIPAGILGLLFQDQLEHLFASPTAAAFFLFINGLLLWGFEFIRKSKHQKAPVIVASRAGEAENAAEPTMQADKRLAHVTWFKAGVIGVAQSASLFPGISRSGITMGGGLLSGLSNEDAARFGFLLSTPIIGAAALLKLPDFLDPANRALIGPALIGALCSGVAAYISVKFLVRFFKTNTLLPFAIYSIIAGIVFSILLRYR